MLKHAMSITVLILARSPPFVFANLGMKEQFLPQRAIGSGSIGRLNNDNDLIAYSISALLYEIPLHTITSLRRFNSPQKAALFTVHVSVSSAPQIYVDPDPSQERNGMEMGQNKLRTMQHWISLWSMDDGEPRLFASTVHGGLINDMSVVFNVRMTVHRRLRRFGSSTPCESRPGYSRNKVKLIGIKHIFMKNSLHLRARPCMSLSELILVGCKNL
jgi:hypothetical protein